MYDWIIWICSEKKVLWLQLHTTEQIKEYLVLFYSVDNSLNNGESFSLSHIFPFYSSICDFNLEEINFFSLNSFSLQLIPCTVIFCFLLTFYFYSCIIFFFPFLSFLSQTRRVCCCSIKKLTKNLNGLHPVHYKDVRFEHIFLYKYLYFLFLLAGAKKNKNQTPIPYVSLTTYQKG